MLSALGFWLLTFCAFGTIIFVHELGHFLAAKRVGVRVDKFYIGMDFWGLKLFKFHHKGTEYGIGIFPLGGYVKLAGQEDMGQAVLEGKPDEFPSKSVWQRIQILFGGVFFNVLSAFVFCALAIYFGYQPPSNLVGDVESGSPAWLVGLQKGDRILGYDGNDVIKLDDIYAEAAFAGLGKHQLLIERDGKKIQFEVNAIKGKKGLASIGELAPATTQAVNVIPDLPAEKAGVMDDDKILSINAIAIHDFIELQERVLALAAQGEKDLVVELERDGKIQKINIALNAQQRGYAGFYPEQNWTIQAVRGQSRAQKLGLLAGQKIISIATALNADQQILDSDQMQKPNSELWKAFKLKNPTGILLRVQGPEKQGIKPQEQSLVYGGSFMELENDLHFNHDSQPVVVEKIEAHSPAETWGLQVGDHITACSYPLPLALQKELNKTHEKLEKLSVSQWLWLERDFPEKELLLGVMRQGKEISVQARLGNNPEPRMILGLTPQYLKGNIPYSFVPRWPIKMLSTAYKSLYALVSARVPSENISGPLGILSVTRKVAGIGLGYLFYLMALISVHIAFLNILPIPVLDGGHILFCLIEGVRGKPVSEKVLAKMQTVGLALLFSLLLFATFNDIRGFIAS